MRPLLGNVASLIRGSFSTTSIKRVVVGRNDEPMVHDLPQIQVYPAATTVELSGTVKDIQTRAIVIRAIEPVPKHLNQGVSGTDTVSSMLSLIDIVEAKEASGAFSTASILGVLRNNPTANSQSLFNNNFNVEYGSLEDLGFKNTMAEVTCEFESRERTV